MFSYLLLFQWKAASRAPIWQKNLVLNMVVGFFIFLFALYLLMLGFLLSKILDEIFPGRNQVELVNSILIYYFLVDLFLRFMMQSLPRLTIESFLHLPVRKNRLVHYMVGRTIFDIFNIIPLLVFVPVTITIMLPGQGSVFALFWIVSIIIMVFANNFLATCFKRLLGAKPLFLLAIGLLLLMMFLAEKTGLISVSKGSEAFFGFLPASALNLGIPIAWMLFAYWLHFDFLKKHLYPDEMQVRKSIQVGQERSGGYLRSFGLTGSIISLEMKLYMRNKRTRTMIYMLPLFLLYGLMFYPNKHYMDQNGFLMFVGIFMTGGLMINYTNYAFGYESSYFDALLTKNVDFYQYIRVKLIIAVITCTVCFILTIPYLFFGYKILLINMAMFLYNIGILSFVLLFFATFNKRRMDLTRGGAFNYQGVGAMNWLAVLPAFLMPILIYIPFNLAGHPYLGMGTTAFLGILGLFFSGYFIRMIGKNFYKRKYIMAASFREK
jgi:hypothetical protein